MAASQRARIATVIITDVYEDNPILTRTVALKPPTWETKIGRGTQNGDDSLVPTKSNAWFDVRVMSRNHAVLKADPHTEALTITDTDSMHGTYVNGKRLAIGVPQTLTPADLVTMGVDVIRGDSFFKAINLSIDWSWSEESATSEPALPIPTVVQTNTFSADYDSDEEPLGSSSDPVEMNSTDEDHEAALSKVEPDVDIDVVKESVPEFGVLTPSHNCTVPESDESDADSYDSIDGSSNHSAFSSVHGLGDEGDGEEEHGAQHDLDKLRTAALPVDMVESSPPHDPEPTSELRAEHDPFGWTEMYTDHHGYGVDEGSDFLLNGTSPHRYLSAIRRKDTMRTPSPSDAAMVKPSIEAATAQFGPYVDRGLVINGLASSLPRSNSTWAGYNSILYDQIAPVPTIPECDLSSESPPPQLPPLVNSSPRLAAFRKLAYPATQASASKLSIASIVDLPDVSPSIEPTNPGLKRKADHIASDPAVERDGFSNLAAASVQLRMNPIPAHLQNAALDIHQTGAGACSADANVANHLTTESEAPPRKKVKTKTTTQPEGRSGGSLLKYAVATLSGVAIGAIATVVGIAALPEEYFV